METKGHDFSLPQRQSIKGIVILFADSIQEFVRAMWAPILLLLYKLDTTKLGIMALIVLGITVFLIALAYLQYRNFTFYLDIKQKEFIINKGVFKKSKITIQLSKIQQVTINQSLIQKLIGVYSLDVDTAGSSKKEVSLRAIDNDLALYLKETLLAVKDTTPILLQSHSNSEHPFIKLKGLTLLKVGLTSNYGRSIALIIGFFASIYGGFQDVIESKTVDEEFVNTWIDKGMAFFSISVFVFLGLIVLLLFNLIRTVVKYFNYTIKLDKGALAVSQGLLAKKNTLLRPVKVQLTSIRQNYFQQKLSLFDLVIKQATSANPDQNPSKESAVDVPGCDPIEKETLLKMILSTHPNFKEILKPNIRFLIFAFLYGVFIPVSVYVGFWILGFSHLENYWIGVVLYCLLVSILVYFRFKNATLFLGREFVAVKQNAWDVALIYLETYKIQGVTTKQYLWHKKSDLVHLTLHTAAGDLHFNYISFSKIKPWIDLWLYHVEQTQKNWM
ncbi:PH domain-containing protein [Flavobacterium sp.]|uniref:PH domain-containing protein n=1 Tax=Flavobacterium sp. TaxID=239 RepID=UPI002FDB431D